MQASAQPLLSCEQLVIGYRGRGLLPPIDLELFPGQLTVVLGRNGSGKSTWLRTVLGLTPPVSGRVRLRDPAPRLAYVAQAAELDPLLPIRARTLVGWSRIRGWGFLNPLRKAADRRPVAEAMERADAAELADRHFSELSGGQQQRVLFARVLAGEAEIALLDEPTASMDLATERAAYHSLKQLAELHRVSVVVVTHTISIACRHADRAIFFDPGDREGEAIAAVGTPDEVCSHELFKRHFGEVWR